MKNVLLTTDFSENAENAINYVINMFGIEDVQYVVLNSYQDISASSGSLVSLIDTLRNDSIDRLKSHEEDLLAANKGIVVESKSIYGSVTQGIKTLSEETAFDYLIIGTKGISVLENLIVGSNTMDVIKSIKIPTLVIPTKFEHHKIHNIAFAADYEKLKDSHILEPMIEVAKLAGAEVKIVNVSEKEEAVDVPHALEGFHLHGILKGVQHQYFTEVNEKVTDGLEVFIKENRIDLMALIAHEYTFFDRIFHRSITKQVSRLTEIPLLIIHE